MNHYFAVFGRSFLSQDDTYSVALVELEAGKEEYSVFTEYLPNVATTATRRKRSTINNGSKMTFDAAMVVYNTMVAQKVNPAHGQQRYIPAQAFSMTNVLAMPDDKAQEIVDRHTKKNDPVPEAPLNREDPKLLECLEDDMWVGVLFNNNGRALAKIGQNVFLDNVALESNHPLFLDAHEIGGEFRFSGYCAQAKECGPELFCAFDMIGDAYKNYDYGTRIQTMANYITGAQTKLIELAQFVVGKDNKIAALDKIGDTFTHIRFMRMDKTFNDGTVRLFPS